jgi:hypothetical protein
VSAGPKAKFAAPWRLQPLPRTEEPRPSRSASRRPAPEDRRVSAPIARGPAPRPPPPPTQLGLPEAPPSTKPAPVGRIDVSLHQSDVARSPTRLQGQPAHAPSAEAVTRIREARRAQEQAMLHSGVPATPGPRVIVVGAAGGARWPLPSSPAPPPSFSLRRPPFFLSQKLAALSGAGGSTCGAGSVILVLLFPSALPRGLYFPELGNSQLGLGEAKVQTHSGPHT